MKKSGSEHRLYEKTFCHAIVIGSRRLRKKNENKQQRKTGNDTHGKTSHELIPAWTRRAVKSATIDAIHRNLQAGRFRFIVLMDHIDDRLKTLISFINTNSQFDIFAVELTYYKHAQADVLIPELFGVQIKTKSPGTSASSSLTWNADQFFVDAKKRLQYDELQAVTRLYEYSAEQAADIRWGRRKSIGTFHPKFSQVRVPRKKWWSPYSVSSDGSLVFNLFRAKIKANDDLINILWKSLQEQGVQGIPDTPIKKTKLPVGQWKTQVDKIMSAVDKALPQWENVKSESSVSAQ